jgi:hypothetical protein
MVLVGGRRRGTRAFGLYSGLGVFLWLRLVRVGGSKLKMSRNGMDLRVKDVINNISSLSAMEI